MKQNILCIILSTVLCLTQAAPAFAVQIYDTADAGKVSIAEPYETEEDAENVASEAISEDLETISEADNPLAENFESADEIGDIGTAVSNSEIETPDSEDTGIETTGPASVQSETDEELVGANVGLGVVSHTPAQIMSYVKSTGVSLLDETTYSRTPNTTAGSYDPGALSTATLESSLAAVFVGKESVLRHNAIPSALQGSHVGISERGCQGIQQRHLRS